MNHLSTRKLKRFLYLQWGCLVVATLVLLFCNSIHYTTSQTTQVIALFIMTTLLAGVIIQTGFCHEVRKRLIRLGVFYMAIAVTMVGLLFLS